MISLNREHTMGGFGSTRWAWASTNDTVEGNRSLDINRLNRAGCLQPGYSGGWEWARDGARVASIWFLQSAVLDAEILAEERLAGGGSRERVPETSRRREVSFLLCSHWLPGPG
jgi:hypothetical protein